MALSKLNHKSFVDTVEGNPSLIINGDFAVAQRNSSSAVTVAHNSYQTVDRILFLISNDGAFTSEQSSTAPDGFSNSLKLAVTTADTSIGATQYAYFDHRIEAQNLQHLNYGTASATDITLSFWVRSSKTGTYCITVQKTDSTRYHFVKEYTIDTADTWEHKTITIAPDSNIKASGGAITNDNGDGLRISWFLSCGSTYASATDGAWSSDTNDYATSNQVNWLDSTSNDFYLTGVKLEVGSATPFVHESYGENLAKCKRYYQIWGNNNANIHAYPMWAFSAANSATWVDLPLQMRATPTLTRVGDPVNTSGGATSADKWAVYQTAWLGMASMTLSTATSTGFRIDIVPNNAFGNSGGGCGLYGGTDCWITVDAEL